MTRHQSRLTNITNFCFQNYINHIDRISLLFSFKWCQWNKLKKKTSFQLYLYLLYPLRRPWHIEQPQGRSSLMQPRIKHAQGIECRLVWWRAMCNGCAMLATSIQVLYIARIRDVEPSNFEYFTQHWKPTKKYITFPSPHDTRALFIDSVFPPYMHSLWV